MLSSERLSNEYLLLNHSGIEHLNDKDHTKLRAGGRVDYLVLYIAEGCCHAEVRGEHVQVPAGSLLIFFPHEPQKYSFYKRDASTCCYLHFTGVGCAHLLRTLGFSKGGVYRVGRSRQLVDAVEKMTKEARLKAVGYEALCAAYLLEFLSLASRGLRRTENQSYQKHSALVDRACELMLAEYKQKHGVAYFAAACHLSVGRFAHLFKESTGVSPYDYLLRIRIDEAKGLLLRSDLSVAEVAERVGFSDQSYFSKAFRKAVGVSPVAYSKGK